MRWDVGGGAAGTRGTACWDHDALTKGGCGRGRGCSDVGDGGGGCGGDCCCRAAGGSILASAVAAAAAEVGKAGGGGGGRIIAALENRLSSIDCQRGHSSAIIIERC